jgi:capsular exopolysaccharide synthesis family protein
MTFNTGRDKIAEGVPLAMIIKREIHVGPELVMLADPKSMSAERFRRLKTTLVHRYGDEAQVIVVTSGIPGEGKSTVSLNLALAFAADSGTRTLLIDADLRRPTIGAKLVPEPHLGLSEVLTRQADLVHAIVHLNNTPLHVLPAGAKPGDPHQVLGSLDAKNLLVSLRERYDRIIVDTPPIIPFTDADTIGAASDGILLVVQAGTTPKAALAQEVAAVTSTRILGVVLNAARSSLADGKSHYDGYYRRYYDKHRRED